MRFLSGVDEVFVSIVTFYAFIFFTPFLLMYLYDLYQEKKQFTRTEQKEFSFAAITMFVSLSVTATFGILANLLKQVTGYKFVVEQFWDDINCKFEPKYLFDDAGLYIVVLTLVLSPIIMSKRYGKESKKKLLQFLPVYLYFLYFFILFPFSFLVERERFYPNEIPPEITEQYKGSIC